MKPKKKTEEELRNEESFWPKSKEALIDYIESLVGQEHDYGTCVYAMSLSAVATFNYVSHRLGATGFQASCADLDVLRRTRSMEGPFMIIKAEDLLYPQCDPRPKILEAFEKWKPWLREQATKRLADKQGACKEVVDHWKELSK